MAKQNHPGDHQQHPHKQGHAGQGHALATHAEHRGDHVDTGRHTADATHQQAQDPVVGAMAAGEGALCQRRIRKPAHVRCRAGPCQPLPSQVAKVEQHTAKQRQPEPKGIQAWEGQITGPDHQGDEIVGQAQDDRHPEEKDHRRPMHGEQAVEHFWRHHLMVGKRQLPAHNRRCQPSQHEEQQTAADIHDPQTLVIDGDHPVVQLYEQWRTWRVGVGWCDGVSGEGHSVLLEPT